MSCSTGSGCSGLLRLALPLAHGKSMTLGKATYALRGGEVRAINVQLTKAGRKAIARRGTARVVASARNLAGTSRTRLLLRAAR